MTCEAPATESNDREHHDSMPPDAQIAASNATLMLRVINAALEESRKYREAARVASIDEADTPLPFPDDETNLE